MQRYDGPIRVIGSLCPNWRLDGQIHPRFEPFSDGSLVGSDERVVLNVVRQIVEFRFSLFLCPTKGDEFLDALLLTGRRIDAVTKFKRESPRALRPLAQAAAHGSPTLH